MSFRNGYRGKRVLLTGHTGFKGSWLAIWLKELGADVYGYALEPKSEMDNFVTTDLANKINHRIGDIRDINALKSFFNEVQPEIVFHLAAQPLVLLSYSDPVNTFETNLMGVVNFFEAVRSTPSIKVAINVTSDKCYDNQEWVWGYRENDPMGGKDPYSASKGCAELITNSYMNSFFKDSSCLIASARAGNVIGGGDWAADRIVPDFFRAINQGKQMVLRNPDATRPWQHVLEPLSGYLALGAALLSGNVKFKGGWNFGPEDNSNYCVGDLIDNIVLKLGRGDYEVPEQVGKLHEANFLKLDISKAVNLLNWRPALSFEQTVSFTVNGYLEGVNGYLDRVSQINEYQKIAKEKEINWSI